MLETFKARLKAKSTAAGASLSTVRIDALADRLNKKFPELKEEADHDAKLDELYTTEDLKDFAAVDDHQRAKTAKEKADKEKSDKEAADKAKAEAEKAKADAEKDKPNPDDTPAWAKALIDQNKSLADRLDGIEKDKTQVSINQKLKDNPKLKDIPETFWNKRKLPEKEDQIESFADEAATDWAAIATGTGVIPPTNTAKQEKGKATKEEVESIVSNILPK